MVEGVGGWCDGRDWDADYDAYWTGVVDAADIVVIVDEWVVRVKAEERYGLGSDVNVGRTVSCLCFSGI